jgi:serine/threonine protein kinase
MAPEFLRKDATTYDERVDWWALGCIVFEMRCGHTPFERPFPKRTPPPASIPTAGHFEALELGHITVVLADFWTRRFVSSSPRSVGSEPFDDAHVDVGSKMRRARRPPRDLFANIVRADAPAVEGDGVATAFVGALLRKQAADRPRWKKIRRHAFFADVDFGKLERRELASPLARGAHSVDDDGDHSDDDDDARRAPPPASPGARSILETSGATDAAGDVVQVDLEATPRGSLADAPGDGDDEPDLSRPTLHVQIAERASQFTRTQRLMSFFVAGDDAPGASRADLFAGFGYRASEDGVLEVAESPPDDAPASPRGRWWNPFSRQKGAVDASDL